ncbi:MAG TPA: YidC/Oxa1 family membrane protein insertase [bacterium]|nr:YidC/Oxa1 family membrane protein insertase [bacterium]
MPTLTPIVDVLRHILLFFYGFTHDFTIAIVLMTLVVKLFLHPLTRVQLRSMKAMQVLAPHMDALKRKHKDDPKALNQEMMALYRAHNVNPMMGCLPMLVQMPVMYALFRLLYTGQTLFGNATVLGIPWMRLDDVPSLTKVLSAFATNPAALLLLVFPVLVAVTTWWQQRMTITDPQQARMFIFMPIMVGYFATLYPIGLSIYWIITTVAYIGEFFLVVGQPHPMASAPPKSQAAAGGGGPKPQTSGAGAVPRSRSQVVGTPPSPLPQGKKGGKRA